MKKVRLRTLMAGPEGCHPSGSVISLEDAQADELVSAGYAEYVEEPKPSQDVIEVAVVEAPEKAILPRRKARRLKR